MPKVTYRSVDGEDTVLDLQPGASVMEAAVMNGLDGILGECGGSLMCATCHVYVVEVEPGQLPPMSEMEAQMLDSAAAEVRPSSRLSCQLKVDETLEHLVVQMPETQS